MSYDFTEARAAEAQSQALAAMVLAMGERTEQMGKTAYADRQARARTDAIRIAADVLVTQPGVHLGTDLLDLADRFAAYILTGSKTTDTPPPPFPGVRT